MASRAKFVGTARMPNEGEIGVRFDNDGFYHPAFGRLGRGKDKGVIHILPAIFGEEETIEVPIVDSSAKPPRPTGQTRTITRYKHLPSAAEVLDYEDVEMLVEGQVDEDTGEQIEEPVPTKRPKTADQAAYRAVTGKHDAKAKPKRTVAGKGTVADPMSAVERTTGAPARRSRKARAEV